MMPLKRRALTVLGLLLSWAGQGVAQQSALPTGSAARAVPNLISYSGKLRDLNGKAITGLSGVTFLLYEDQEGGVPLWLEIQNVTPDSTGRYTVQLGSTNPNGLPPDLFRTGAARWLGIQIERQPEQPRVLLVAVPYALKAADAETIGGLPPSAFVLVGQANPTSSSSVPAEASPALPSAALPPSTSNVTTTGGTIGAVPLWTTASNIQSSSIAQLGTGAAAKIGIGTSSPASTLDVKGSITARGILQLPSVSTATATSGSKSQPLNLQASAFNSSTSAAVNQAFQWQAEPVSNNTASPSGSLNLLFGSGTSSPSETGLKINSSGQFTFAKGQTFPGAGTITGITTSSGSGLAGGGTSGTLSLSITAAGVTNAMLQNPSITLTPGSGLTGGGKVSLGGTTTLGLTTSCTGGQVLQWSGTAWVCATVSGSGTITGVTAGTDLTGGGTSGNVTLNLNTAALQASNDARYSQLGATNTFAQPQAINSSSMTSLTVTSSMPTAQVIYGHATSTSPSTAYGILGGADGTNGVGVWGFSNGAAGYGVQGKGLMNGIMGWSGNNSSIWNSYSGVGVHGDNAGGFGVLGTVDSGFAVAGIATSGTGVFGSISGTTLNTAGVSGVSGSNSGFSGIAAVWGDSYLNAGVYGTSGNFSGVLGQSQNSYGLQGVSSGSDGVNALSHSPIHAGVAGINDAGGFGVYGYSAGGPAGLFNGDVQISGKITSYNGNWTTGNGVTSVPFQTSFYSNGSGGGNNYLPLYTPVNDGVYRISGFQECASTSGGQTYFSMWFVWTLPNGGGVGDAISGSTCSVLNGSHGSFVAHVKGGTPIQYNYAGMDAPFTTLIVIEQIM